MCLAILCTARVTGIILFARVSPRRTLHSLREGEYALLPVSCLNGHIVVKPNIPAWRNIVPQQELVALHSPVSLHLLIRNLRLHPSVLLLRSTEVRRTWCWALFRAGRQVSPERMLSPWEFERATKKPLNRIRSYLVGDVGLGCGQASLLRSPEA